MFDTGDIKWYYFCPNFKVNSLLVAFFYYKLYFIAACEFHFINSFIFFVETKVRSGSKTVLAIGPGSYYDYYLFLTLLKKEF